MEAEISGYLSHPAIFLASLGLDVLLLLVSGQLQCSFSSSFFVAGGLLQVLQRLDQDRIGRLLLMPWISDLHRSGSGAFQTSTGSFRTLGPEGKHQ